MLVRRCGELCVSHVRSPDYSRCKATEEQASPVAGNGHLTVEPVQDVQSLRSVQPLRSVFSDVLNGLNALNVLNQAYPLLSLQFVMLFPRTVNHLG
jgi:hypothetical protein